MRKGFLWLQGNKHWLITFAGVSFLSFVVLYRDRGLAADDSYIHRRIVERYADTGLAWYNTGERVMGTSSPVWTIVMALAFRLFGHPDLVVLIVEALILASATTIAGLLAQRLQGSELQLTGFRMGLETAQIVGASLLAWLLLLESAVAQMETPLALALLLAGAWQLSGESRPGLLNARANIGLALITVAAFTRLEFAPLVPLAAVALVAGRKFTISGLATSAVVVASGCWWSMHQFGTLIPNTITAKSTAYRNVDVADLFHRLHYSFRSLPFFIFFLLLFLWSLWKIEKREISYIAIFLLAGGLLLAILYAVRGVLVFPWYAPLVVLPLKLGVWLLARPAGGNLNRVLAIVLTIWGIREFMLNDKHILGEATLGIESSYVRLDPQAARVHEYLKIGSALNKSCPTATLLTSEIGALGYTFHGHLLDGLGLVTPGAVKYHPLHYPEDSPSKDDGAIPPEFAQEVKADLIVTYQFHGEVVVKMAREMGYEDIAMAPFLAEDRVRQRYYLGAVHVLVREAGACEIPKIKEALMREKVLDRVARTSENLSPQ